MIKHARKVEGLSNDAVDIVGTGGDGADTVNISTGAAILTAASGVKVAKVIAHILFCLFNNIRIKYINGKWFGWCFMVNSKGTVQVLQHVGVLMSWRLWGSTSICLLRCIGFLLALTILLEFLQYFSLINRLAFKSALS